MKKLLTLLVALATVTVTAQLSNIPIGKMPIAPTLKPSAWIPIIQPYDGRTTNDNFRISPTNFWGINLWTNANGRYLPTESQSSLLANGITAAQYLLTTGSLSDTPVTNATLALGPNDISVFQKGTVWLPSPSGDPSSVEIRLGAGNGNGNYLTLVNAGPDGTGFTLFNGSELYNGAGNYVHLPHGNWVTTNKYDGILLKGGSIGWFEVGRWNANTNVISGDAIWANTNLVTFVRPEFGSTVRWGNSASNWTAGVSDGLVVLHDQAGGESEFNSLLFGATDDASNPQDESWLYTFLGSGASTAAMLQLFAATNYQNPSAPISKWEVNLDPRNGLANVTLVNANATTFHVEDNSGYENPGLRFLSNDGTYWPQDTNTTAGLWVVDENNVLQPVDLTWQPMVNQGWVVGEHTLDVWGGPLTAGEVLVSIADQSKGDPSQRSIYMATVTTNSFDYPYGEFYFAISTNSETFSLNVMKTSEDTPQSNLSASLVPTTGQLYSTIYGNDHNWNGTWSLTAHTNSSSLTVSSFNANVNAAASLFAQPEDVSGNASFLSVDAVDTVANAGAYLRLFGHTNSALWIMSFETNAIASTLISGFTDWTNAQFVVQSGAAQSVIQVNPPSGSSPVDFDTLNAITDRPLVRVRNANTNQFTIGPGPQVGFGSVISNSLALLDPDLVFTNFSSQVQIGAINAAGDHAYLQANPDHSARLYAPDGYAALENASQIVRLNSTYFEPGTAGAVSLGGPNGNWWGDAGVTQVYVKGFDAPGGNHSWLTIYSSGTNTTDGHVFSSISAGTAGTEPRPFVFTNAPVRLNYVTKVQKSAITPHDGEMVYQTDNTPGLRAYVNGAWVIVQTAADP